MTPHECEPKDAPEGWYWACEQPERPPDDRAFFDSTGCADCARVAVVLAASGDDGVLLDVDGTEHPLDLSDLEEVDA